MPYKNPEARRLWLQRNREKVRLYNKRYREKHKEQIREYYRRRAEDKKRLKQKAIKLLGGKCFICGRSEGVRLELHHLKGYPSPYLKAHNKEKASWDTIKECLAYPERFALLCTRCHGTVSFFRTYPERIKNLLSLL